MYLLTRFGQETSTEDEDYFVNRMRLKDYLRKVYRLDHQMDFYDGLKVE